ncbi:MAG: serine/threonine protein kinase [Phycisphaeraceae bacterium]|nr:serine/threonine protein kinase [Phycisphaeraceae bacterium]
MASSSAKDIFLDALELPPAEREGFVRGACDGDAALLEAVERLVRAHEAANRVFLGAPTVDVSRVMRESATDDALVEQPGARLGAYVIREKIGEGGFAIVYRAEQEAPVRREVALKVLKAGMDSAAVIRRFESERQTLARMSHPGIARILDAGTTGAGRPWFAMELVDGLPITEYCDLHRLTVRERLRLFHRVCLAVQHAHQKGVIHRDIKPGNVLIVGVDGAPEARVIDFGIAKALAQDDGGGVTATGQFVGTPLYMAPEQASGGVIDTRTDVYALGVVLYELLAGATPFDTTRLESAPLIEVLRVIRDEDAPRPSTKIASLGDAADTLAVSRRTDPHRLWRELRGDLDNLVARAIEKDPARRYPGVTALADDVQRYLDGMPLEAGPPTVRYRASKALRRHKVGFAAAGVMGLAVVALASGAVVFGLRQRENAERLEAQRARSDTAAEFARGILTGVDPARARGADTTLLREILADATTRVESELRDAHPEAAFDMRTTLGVVYSRIGDLDAALRLFTLASVDAAERFGPGDVRTLEVTSRRATTLTEMGRYDEAIALMTPVLEQHRRARGDAHPETQSALLNLATMKGRAGRSEEARPLLEEVYALRLRTLGADHESTQTAANNLAVTLSDLGDDEGAAGLLRSVLDAQIRTLGEEHPRPLTTAHNLAGALVDAGREDEATALMERTFEIKKRVLGEGHPSTMVTAGSLGSVYSRTGRAAEAEALFRRAIEVAETSLSPDDPRRVSLLNGLGGLMLREDRPEEAEPLLARAGEIMARVAGEDHPQTLRVRANHANALLRLRRYDETRDTAERAREAAKHRLGPAHPITVDLTRTLAFALDGSGERDAAVGLLREARAECADNAQAERIDEALARVAGAGAGG